MSRRISRPDHILRRAPRAPISLSEALNNTVVHAYRNSGGRVEVRASVDAAAGVIAIGVRDYGIGCNARTDSPGIGMGLPLMTAGAHR